MALKVVAWIVAIIVLILFVSLCLIPSFRGRPFSSSSSKGQQKSGQATRDDAALEQKGTASIPKLVEEAKCGNSLERARAIDALSKMTPIGQETLATLMATLKNDGDASVRVAAISALERVSRSPWGRDQDANIVVAVAEALTDANVSVREEAAEALDEIASRAPASETVPFLRISLEDESALVRRTSIRILAKMGSTAEEAVPELMNALNDRAPEIRIAAAIAMVEIEGLEAVSAIPVLLEALADNRQAFFAGTPVQQYVTSALGDIGTAAIPQLLEAIKDEDPHVRCGAFIALGNIGPEAREFVPEMLNVLKFRGISFDSDRDFRSVVDAPSRAPAPGDPDWLPWALGLSPEQDRPIDVRPEDDRAVEVPPEVSAVLAIDPRAAGELALGLHDADPDVRDNIVRILNRMGRNAITELLTLLETDLGLSDQLAKGLLDTDPDETVCLLHSLGPHAVPLLIRVLKDEDAAAQRQAARVMAEIGPEIIPQIRSIWVYRGWRSRPPQ